MRPIVAATWIFDEEGRLLLGYKLDKEAWEVPGGKINDSETLVECAKRELKEETGIADVEDLFYVGYYDSDPRFLTHMFCGCTQHNAQVMEPDKHSKWRWFHLDMLPTMTPECKAELAQLKEQCWL